MLRGRHIPVRIWDLLKSKHSLIDHWLDLLRLHKSIHLPEHLSRADDDSPNGTAGPQSVKDCWHLTIRGVAEHASTGNKSIGANGGQRLRYCGSPSNINNDMRAFAVWSQRLDVRAPVRRGAIVERVMCADRFEALLFRFGTCCSDYRSAGGDGELR